MVGSERTSYGRILPFDVDVHRNGNAGGQSLPVGSLGCLRIKDTTVKTFQLER